MAKGGTQQTTPYVPEFAETGMQQIVGMGQDIAPLADTPTALYGPQVAAFSPLEQASFQGTDVMADAFGMPSTGGQSYLPQAQMYEGGLQGYSAAPLANQMVDQFKYDAPAQYDYRMSFGMDPVTGEVGSRAPQNQPVSLEMQGGGGGK
jgi:hypothetical protein